MLTILLLALVVSLPADVANADFTFGTPTNLGPTVNSSANEVSSSISADGLTLYFQSKRSGGFGGYYGDIWVTTRATTNDPWGEPVNLGPSINTSSSDGGPSISADGLTLYFGSDRPGGYGALDIWLTTRPTVSDPWGTPVNLGSQVNSSSIDGGPSISANGRTLFFASDRSGGYGNDDIWVTRRATTEDDWGTPVNLGPTVNSSTQDHWPSISADGLTLFFDSRRPGGSGSFDLWVTTRATTDDDWGTPVNLGPTVNSSAYEFSPSLSGDGSTLSFMSNRPGGVGSWDMWQVSILPVVDFNGDGIVDSADMCIMVDHWGTDEPLCDIGPMPWGDGIVDVQDLIVLAEHFFEEVYDPTLIAYWALDEAEGSIVYDSAGNYDGTLNGNPLWQPTGGKVDGALAFDGTDDYVSTDRILDPADGAFSVVAWVKGGASGQVVISQAGGGNWLLTDPQAGALMTQLKGSGRTGGTLLSQTVVTDGEWHRIGLVWDGSYRTLYVDGTEVAKDTQAQDHLESANGGLHLGAGATLDAASFFSGLIDDVRIYNRAVIP